jgi:hypothetical protein
MQSLIGTWRLIEACAFDEDGNALPPPLGPKPMGIILYEAERMVVAVCDGRLAVPQEAAERVFSSYTGIYLCCVRSQANIQCYQRLSRIPLVQPKLLILRHFCQI